MSDTGHILVIEDEADLAHLVAEELDVSRSNIYATRKRVARKLGVHPDLVADEATCVGLTRV